MKKENITNIFIDIQVGNFNINRLYFKIIHDLFPEGVRNFIEIIIGDKYKIDKSCDQIYYKKTMLSYNNNIFYECKYNKYIITGDIYNNTGSNYGTIFNNNQIEGNFGEYYYPHDSIGLISLIPTIDNNGNILYDSRFMITMNNNLEYLDEKYIVIGYIYKGVDTLKNINNILKPMPSKNYPIIKIISTGIINNTYKCCNKIYKN